MTQDNEFVSRMTPNFLSSFMEYTKVLPSPTRLRKWAGLVAVAGALERRCWVVSAGMPLYPNMFVVLCAPPATGKSVVISQVHRLWNACAQLAVAPTAATFASTIDFMDETKKFIHWANGDKTIQQSIVFASSELGQLLHGHDIKFMNVLNELYDCGRSFEERKRYQKGDPIKIENPSVSILAGTQPAYLGTILPELAFQMGFTSRTVFVYDDKITKVDLFTEKKIDEELFDKLIGDMISIAKMQGEFRIDEDAKEFITTWHQVVSDADKPTNSRLHDYCGRRILVLLKMSMAMSAAESSSRQITLQHVQDALEMLLDAEGNMDAVFVGMEASPDKLVMESLMSVVTKRWLQNRRQPVAESVLHQFLSDKIPVQKIPYIIDTMCKAGKFKIIAGATPGTFKMFEPVVKD